MREQRQWLLRRLRLSGKSARQASTSSDRSWPRASVRASKPFPSVEFYRACLWKTTPCLSKGNLKMKRELASVVPSSDRDDHPVSRVGLYATRP